jgi:hypothetical protein
MVIVHEGRVSLVRLTNVVRIGRDLDDGPRVNPLAASLWGKGVVSSPTGFFTPDISTGPLEVLPVIATKGLDQRPLQGSCDGPEGMPFRLVRDGEGVALVTFA